jgi:LysR family tcuABC transcriptional regulator
MNERDLRYIVAIAREGNIQKAAAAMDKNASSLSRCIKRVEGELKIVLFQRTPAGLVPTPEGEAYVKTAKRILSLYDGLKG